MLKVLKKVAALDTEGRALAVGIGTELPPVDYTAIK